MIEVTIERANACGSFDRAVARAFFLGAAEEPSDFAFAGSSGFLEGVWTWWPRLWRSRAGEMVGIERIERK